MRADSGYYSRVGEDMPGRGVEFFIVAKQQVLWLNARARFQDSNWKSFAAETYRQTLGAGGGSAATIHGR